MEVYTAACKAVGIVAALCNASRCFVMRSLLAYKSDGRASREGQPSGHAQREQPPRVMLDASKSNALGLAVGNSSTLTCPRYITRNRLPKCTEQNSPVDDVHALEQPTNSFVSEM